MSFRLTRAAENDLAEIYRYSLRTFGPAKADEYFDGLVATFDRLTDNPGRGRDCHAIRPGTRRAEYVSHSVYYRVAGSGILILRVLHRRMDPARHL